MMKKARVLMPLIAALLAVGLTATSALAASPHVKSGPSFTDNGLTLTATVTYAGLGNFDTTQNLSATGNPTATCTNPAGATQPPGQNPASVTLTGSTSVPASDIKNGNVTLTTTTNAPTSPIPGAPGCPNRKWTETITDVAFTSATITLSQNNSVVVTVSCTFSPPTSNGPVPSSGFTCS
jgi:hypothetical protein